MATPDRRSRPRAGRSRKRPLRHLVEEDRKNAYRRAINEAAERVFAEKMQVEYTKFIEDLRENTYIQRTDIFVDQGTALPAISSQGAATP